MKGRTGESTTPLHPFTPSPFHPFTFFVMLAVAAGPVRADRNILAPRGLIAIPNSIKLEFASTLSDPHDNIGWLTLGMPPQINGLELEATRFERDGERRGTVSAQYSLTGNAFSDLAPAVSVGVRDMLNQGGEARAFFVAATKTGRLSAQQERVLRDWKLDVGYGTSHLDGAYIGLQGRFAFGFTANVEYLARRFNATITWPVARHFNLKAYSLNGETFFGASVYLVK